MKLSNLIVVVCAITILLFGLQIHTPLAGASTTSGFLEDIREQEEINGKIAFSSYPRLTNINGWARDTCFMQYFNRNTKHVIYLYLNDNLFAEKVEFRQYCSSIDTIPDSVANVALGKLKYKPIPSPIAEGPIDEATKVIIDETTNKTIDEATKVIIDETTNKTIDETTKEIINETTKEIINETTNKTIDETTKEIINETTNKTIDEATKVIIDETTNKTIDETTKDTIDETTKDTIDETTKDTIDETTKELIDETTKEPIDETTKELTEPTAEPTTKPFSSQAEAVDTVQIQNGTATFIKPGVRKVIQKITFLHKPAVGNVTVAIYNETEGYKIIDIILPESMQDPLATVYFQVEKNWLKSGHHIYRNIDKNDIEMFHEANSGGWGDGLMAKCMPTKGDCERYERYLVTSSKYSPFKIDVANDIENKMMNRHILWIENATFVVAAVAGFAAVVAAVFAFIFWRRQRREEG